MPTVVVGGLVIGALDRAGWRDRILAEIRHRRGRRMPPFCLTSANGNVISLAARDPAFAFLLEQADAIDADGMSIVAATRLLTLTPLVERCATTDFFHDLATAAQASWLSFYMLGATPDANAAAIARVRRMYPDLRIAGHRHGYFRPEEEADVVARIRMARPDILWIGLGVPREQEFLIRNRERLRGIPVAKTCGGLFDFLSGSRRRAPLWMQRAGLEWAWRVLLEPRRLAGRYLVTTPHAIWCMLRRSGGRSAAQGAAAPREVIKA